MDINNKIADCIFDKVREADGRFETAAELDNLTIEVNGWACIETEIEDDYFNGTGAEYITDATVSIRSVQLINENGEQMPLPDALSFARIETIIEKELLTL